jgi:hypothetical protein
LTEERVLDRTNDEEMVLDRPDGQEGDSAGVKGLEERYWMRFLKGMVTDRNRRHILCRRDICAHAL